MDFRETSQFWLSGKPMFSIKDYFKSEFQNVEELCKSVCMTVCVCMCLHMCVKQRPAVAIITACPSCTLPSLLQPIFVHFGRTFKLALTLISSCTQHYGVWAHPWFSATTVKGRGSGQNLVGHSQVGWREKVVTPQSENIRQPSGSPGGLSDWLLALPVAVWEDSPFSMGIYLVLGTIRWHPS